MNLNLLPPASFQGFPDIIEYSWESRKYYYTCCRFNSTGTLVACGTASGHLVLYDMYTRAICVSMRPHSAPVVQLQWSSYTRPSTSLIGDGEPSRPNKPEETCLLVCTASSDWSVAVCDLRTRRYAHMDLDCPLLRAEFVQKPSHHHNQKFIHLLCTLSNDLPVLIQLNIETFKMERIESGSSVFEQDALLMAAAGYCCPQLNLACFATTQGKIHVYSMKVTDDEVVPVLDQTFKVSAGSISSVTFSANSAMMLVNSTDRALRLYSVQKAREESTEKEFEIALLQKYQDSINRIQWGPAAFSPTNDHFTTASPQHNLYIFNCTPPYTLHKILDGPKSSPACQDASYHPRFPGSLLTLCSNTGAVFVWMRSGVDEYWSGYAPGFKELENNVEYFEREVEFDTQQDDDQDDDAEVEEGSQVSASRRSLGRKTSGGEDVAVDVEADGDSDIEPDLFGVPLIIDDLLYLNRDDNLDEDDEYY